MFRYNLCTLLILMAVGPPVLAVAWLEARKAATKYQAWHQPMPKQDIHAPMITGIIEIVTDSDDSQ
jgi:hypothetical protein